MCLENDHRLPTEQRFAPPIVEEAGNTPVLETVNNTTENPDTALDLNPPPIHFQRGALGGSSESLDTSTDPSRDEDMEVMEVKPHPRPIERVSACYAARTGAPPPSVAGRVSRRSQVQEWPLHHWPLWEVTCGLSPGRTGSSGQPRCDREPSQLNGICSYSQISW